MLSHVPIIVPMRNRVRASLSQDPRMWLRARWYGMAYEIEIARAQAQQLLQREP